MKLLFTSVAALAATFALPAAAQWDYGPEGGPDAWGDLAPEYAACGAGRMQSPIDLGEANAVGDIKISVDYVPGPLTVSNKGKTVQADFAPGSSMTSGGTVFPLVQVHFHTPSEHAIDGERYPLTAHFVHATEAGRLAVLGIMFAEGAANPDLQKILDAVPAEASVPRRIAGVTLDPNAMLPESIAVYRYMGSLTTPPCSEGVNWHVVKAPMTASAGQIVAFQALMNDNARPVLPINNRLVVAPAD